MMESSFSKYSFILIFIWTFSNKHVVGNKSQSESPLKCVRCKYPSPTEFPNFPPVTEANKRGISIGFCDPDSGPTNVKCNKDKSVGCVSLTISKSLTPSCNKELSKYFPEEIQDKWFKDKPSYQMKGCWNSNLDNELELMFDECGGELEKEFCQESLCNKDADPPVLQASVFIGVPLALIVLVLILVFIARRQQILCFRDRCQSYEPNTQEPLKEGDDVENNVNVSRRSSQENESKHRNSES